MATKFFCTGNRLQGPAYSTLAPDYFESHDQSERQYILNLMPQSSPFRFVDVISELSSHHIVASYRFRQDEWFYSGHFPGDPVTPGVILIEAMAQAGLVALGLFILSREQPGSSVCTLFTECSIEFLGVVGQGKQVFIRGERLYWRRNKLRSKVELRLEDGLLAAVGTVSGMGVKR